VSDVSCALESRQALHAALGTVTMGLIACVSLGPATPPTRYELSAKLDGQPVAGSGPAMVVATPTAAPGFDGPRIVYVRTPHKLEFFSRSEWVDTPARMLAPLLVRALERSGRFQAVAEARTASVPGLRLESEVVRLQHEFTPRPSRVRLTVRVQLSDVASRRVLGAHEFEAVEEALSDDVYGGVVAANRAVRRVLDDIVAYCGEAAGPAAMVPRAPFRRSRRRVFGGSRWSAGAGSSSAAPRVGESFEKAADSHWR
jgi:cholesterol transport system auxiliary component